MSLVNTCEITGNETLPEPWNFHFKTITKINICSFMYTGTRDDDDSFTLSQDSFQVSRPEALSGLHVLLSLIVQDST